MSATSAVSAVAQADINIEASLKTSGIGSADVSDDNVVPVIDLSSGMDDAALSKELWEAARTVGFFTLVGHGIDQTLIDRAFAASEEFFQQPLDVKHQQSPGDMRLNSGFEHFSQVRPSTGLKDQKESLQITARQGCMDGRWPSPEFQTTANELMAAAHQLAGRVLDLLEPIALTGASQSGERQQQHILRDSHTLWGDDGQCTLRFLHYPALTEASQEDVDGLIDRGYWRAGPHTDWANITLLFQRPGQTGLECCANPRQASSADDKAVYWTAVNPVEVELPDPNGGGAPVKSSGIAVNIGDMLSRWSDGKLYSNLHRVRLPRNANVKARYSIAFFAQSDKKTLMESQHSEPITAGDYILSRIRSNFAK